MSCHQSAQEERKAADMYYQVGAWLCGNSAAGYALALAAVVSLESGELWMDFLLGRH